MKHLKIGTAVLALCLLVLAAAARADAVERPAARYTAIAAKQFDLRPAPKSGVKVGKVPFDRAVEVLEYGDDWCHVRYRGKVGYARTTWLWGFVSLDPLHYPSPQFTPCRGYVTLAEDTLVAGGKFAGVTAAAGTVLAVYDADLSLPVWRDVAGLPAAAGAYTAFADWETAQPGDPIAGFTTYYNEKTGAPLAKGRQHNIALGCERIDGQVVQPGETFSFNALCAPYSTQNGYEMAKNISNSGKGAGGGVCQVSTTLYNALLSLPVRITAWAAHRPAGVYYIPKSFDSAVGSRTDLCFSNDLPYPVRIVAKPQGGALTVLLFAAKE